MSKPLYKVPPGTLSEFVFHSNWIELYSPYDYPYSSRLYKAHLRAAKLVLRTGEWDPPTLHLALLDGTDMLPPEQVGIFRTMQVYIGGFVPPSPGRHLLAHVERWRAMVDEGPGDEDPERWTWRMHDELSVCTHFQMEMAARVG